MDALGLSPAVNVKFIFDGEEEIDSPSLGPFAEAHRDLLAADVVIITDGPQHARGRPSISGGARGMMKVELMIEAARRDLHSGNFVVPNPAWKLGGLLASMATSDSVPLIEAFEEDVVGPTAAERRMMAALPLDLPALENDLGVRLPADYVERIMFHPTLTISGLHSGFVGTEANTIIPHRATVALEIIDAVERAHGGERAVLLPTMGGTVPMWVFTDLLKIPTLLVPYANQNNRQHGPNEHMRLDHLFRGIRTTAQLLADLGMSEVRR